MGGLRMKKKLLACILSVAMVATMLTGCGSKADVETVKEATETTTEEKVDETTEVAESTGEKFKIGILAPAVTHGWVAAVAYNAEVRCKELADTVDYKLYTSTNAEEMTTQLDDLKTWGAQAIVAFPQWEGMEVPIQSAIDSGIQVVNFDIAINADGVYRVSGDNEDMGVQGAKYIVDKIGTEGTVVVLNVPTAGSVSELREKGFVETLSEIAPDMNVITYATALQEKMD